VDDFDWQYFQAQRLVAQYNELDSQSRGKLDGLIESLRSERPDWFPMIALCGDYAVAAGDRRRAIEAYRLAIDMGERRPEVYERLVRALFADGKYNEANSYLARLADDESADGRFDSLSIALAIKENRLEAALEMAKTAVKRGSVDSMHYVWLANLLSLAGRQQEAEQVFRDSILRFPKDPRVWNGLFTYFVRNKRPDNARRTLEQWSEKVAVNETSKQYILAQGYESLGDVETARRHYRNAIEKDSRNIDARLRLAGLLLSNDRAAARQQFEEVLKIDPKNRPAKRNVAALLATSGNDEDWNHALKLLSVDRQATGTGDEIADDRLRAILLSRRGRNRAERLQNCEAARRILAARLSQREDPALDLDRTLLAGIYEQEADMRDDVNFVLAARDALRPLVDRQNVSADNLVRYLQLLLRNLERQANAPGGSYFDAGQRTVLINDAQLRIDALERMLSANGVDDRRFFPVAFRVRLLVVQQRSEEALQVLTEFAEKQLAAATNDTDRAKVLLTLGNIATSTDHHAQAEKWYRQLLAIAPSSYVLLAKSLMEQQKANDAVEVCLHAAPKRSPAEVATVLTQLLGADARNQELNARIEPIIVSALSQAGDNVDLLTSVAVRHVTEDNYEEAVKLFRRVIELQPNHALAMNNLATLLAERPNQLGEARKYAERAMAVAGRSPALLDTLGTILIFSGEHEEALAVLEEAVAGAVEDPRYYFHLAVAYQRLGRNADSQKSLSTAQKHGLDRAILTASDRELLASLKRGQVTIVQPNQ
jgi:tetratricopeptide (TPR) repeat protein